MDCDNSSGITMSEISIGFKAACKIWADHAKLSFVEVVDAHADILISFFDGRNAGCSYCKPGFNKLTNFAHGFFPPSVSGDSGISGDIHFNKNTQWSMDQSEHIDTIDFVTVAAHELGHVIGLNHVGLSDALMHAHCKIPHRYLHEDDINGIQHLYGPPD